MRELFLSERRYIANVLRKGTNIRLETSGAVVLEEYCPPRTSSRVRFNNDYFLQFVSREDMKDAKTKSFCAPVLPNTLGVDVFVTVDEHTSQLLMTELLGGEAFSMYYFREHIEKIEVRLAQLSHPINLRKTSYCRIFVIEHDICFLAYSNEVAPVVRGKRELLCADAESSIACSTEGNQVVYVDAWIRTHIEESERKFEAILVNPEDN